MVKFFLFRCFEQRHCKLSCWWLGVEFATCLMKWTETKWHLLIFIIPPVRLINHSSIQHNPLERLVFLQMIFHSQGFVMVQDWLFAVLTHCMVWHWMGVHIGVSKSITPNRMNMSTASWFIYSSLIVFRLFSQLVFISHRSYIAVNLHSQGLLNYFSSINITFADLSTLTHSVCVSHNSFHSTLSRHI